MMATFVFIKSSNPISPRKIPDIPAFKAQPRRAGQRDRSHRACSSQPRAERKIVQIMQKRQHDKRVQRKFVAEHAFHMDASNTGDGEEIKNDGGEIKGDAHSTVRSEEHTSELQSRGHLVCRLLLEK